MIRLTHDSQGITLPVDVSLRRGEGGAAKLRRGLEQTATAQRECALPINTILAGHLVPTELKADLGANRFACVVMPRRIADVLAMKRRAVLDEFNVVNLVHAFDGDFDDAPSGLPVGDRFSHIGAVDAKVQKDVGAGGCIDAS